MRLNKVDFFNRFYCLDIKQINKLTPHQLIEKVFEYIEEEYDMYAKFHDEVDLKTEFRLIRKLIASNKVF